MDELGKGSWGLSLRSVEYMLDGGPFEAEGGARLEVSPGVHVLGVRLVYEGRSPLFGYLDGYRFVMQGRITFKARPGNTVQVWSTGYAHEGWTVRWQDRPGFRLEGRPQGDILRIENGLVEREPLEPETEGADEKARQVVDEVLAQAEASAPRKPCRQEPVLFDFADTQLRPEAREALARLSRCLLSQPSLRLRLVGHCDARGTGSLNANLGLGRALTVAGFLWSQGVPRERLEVDTRGTEALVCQKRTEACYARSRRVEFIPVAR
ncbi:OmpA family protein [Archangium sp.]|uniref:OmpA family protein n=1 Tax=Archangium sp. TaxID=1872627 RepID=UPI002D70FA1E|nr:OmpA family protein [Archangium sp.]HYO56258.1 OmpA family protein [Archangium sp.]